MTSNSLTSTDPSVPSGLLRVEVPHWAAQIRVFNNRGRIIRQVEEMSLEITNADKSQQTWSASTTLPFGVYEVEVLIDAQTARQLAIIHSPDGYLLTKNSWDLLIQLKSSAPLAGTVTTRESQRDPAVEWSHKITWNEKSGNSGLFLFVRTLTPEKRTRFFDNLSLFDQYEKLINSFKEGVELNKKAGWMAFNASLPAGFYCLKRQQYGSHRTCYQPLYLCEGWQTQAFIEAKQRPSLRTLTLNMARLGEGFRPDDENVLAATIILNNLKGSIDPDRLATIETVKKLMGGKIENPWLAILAAYTIRLQEDQMLLDDDSLSDLWPQMLKLLPELLDYLTIIREHPDVQALTLDKSNPAETPIQYPPLLYTGLRRAQQHALKFAKTIPVGSVLERILPRVATQQPGPPGGTLFKRQALVNKQIKSPMNQLLLPKWTQLIHRRFLPKWMRVIRQPRLFSLRQARRTTYVLSTPNCLSIKYKRLSGQAITCLPLLRKK